MNTFIELGRRLVNQRFVRYFIVGCATFAIDFGLLVLLHGILRIDVLIAATISYWGSIVFNFFINRWWTFRSSDSDITRNISLYLILLLVNYLFSVGFIWAGTTIGVHYTIAKIAATILQVGWTYVAYKKVVFI